MNKWLLLLCTTGLLAGCSSSLPHPNLEFLNDYSGGQSTGDVTRLYWYTEYQNRPVKGSEYVLQGEHGHYQTSYRWEEGQVREVVREGMQLKDKTFVPYQVHLRFNPQGEAVYQQFRVEGKVLPLNQQQREEYLKQAQSLSELSKTQANQDVTLYQGFWDGQAFTSCTQESFANVSFASSVPDVITQRLVTDHYLVLLAKPGRARLEVQQVLMIAESEHACIERPALIETE
ncbi:DUF1481 domain-containing protein [Vibrio cincinnatiensis]|uniref:DUF1481 domain-containing protein n=1 Tax=Vibrio cincinnatiensis TaxID=675 RepID=UPI001EE1179B|nr:DUF1481 domain-containing protein [Vibrio cincinnatiensis]MCG3748421.1 DUF1481 domain-containing protein [Vibrio cincinnatiensis]